MPPVMSQQLLEPHSHRSSTGASPSHSSTSNPDSPHHVEYINGSVHLIDDNGIPIDLQSIGPPLDIGSGQEIPINEILFGNYDVLGLTDNPEYSNMASVAPINSDSAVPQSEYS